MNRRQRRANAKRASRSVGPAVAGLLELGLKSHGAGKLAEAEGYYRRVLAIQPNHPDALQLFGVAAYQMGRYDVAVEWFSHAIQQNGSNRAERAVRTASAAQVRRPIYASSIGRARAYRPFLGPLLAELMPLL